MFWKSSPPCPSRVDSLCHTGRPAERIGSRNPYLGRAGSIAVSGYGIDHTLTVLEGANGLLMKLVRRNVTSNLLSEGLGTQAIIDFVAREV